MAERPVCSEPIGPGVSESQSRRRSRTRAKASARAVARPIAKLAVAKRGRDALRTGRGGLDPIELRDVRDETSEKHRRGEDVGASGLSNPTLAEEQEEQAEAHHARPRKAGGGT